MPTFSKKGGIAYELDDRVEILFLSDLLGTTVNSFFNQLKRFFLLRKFIRDSNPDVIISFMTQVNVVAILSAFNAGKPLIVSERTYPPNSSLSDISYSWRILRRITYPLANAVVMQTEQGLDWLKDNIKQAKGFTISNPVEKPIPFSTPDLKVENYISPDINLCLVVGRLVKDKRLEGIIEAFKKNSLDNPSWNLVFLGQGEELKSLTKMVEIYNLEEKIFFLGRAGNLHEWYERADLFVLNSRVEGFPNSLLEAMSYGVPCISADCETGPRDIIKDKINGFLVPVNENKSYLEEAMSVLMSDVETRKSLSLKALDSSRTYSVTRIGRQWDNLIKSIVKFDEG